MRALIEHLKPKFIEIWKRLRQPSTVAGLTTIFTAAAALPQPLSSALIVVGVLGILYPQGAPDAA